MQCRFPRGALALALFAAAAVAHAQAYPSKPVRMIVGFPSGTSADVTARLLAGKLSDALGQQFVVDNRPGASSNIGTEAVVRAPADGYTVLMGSIANTINTTMQKNLPFDFAKDLAPIALVATVPNLLVVNPSVAANSVGEFIALAKAKPGTLLYGSSGNGTSPHLSGELFNLMAGTKLVHVPYKGSSQAMTDLLGGRVQVMFSPASTALPHIQAGKLKALASTGAQRAKIAPDLPTLNEAGLPGFDTEVWFGLLAPAATPREIVDRLVTATNAALKDDDLRGKLLAQGIEPLGGTPAQFQRYIQTETAKWAKAIEASGAKAE